ncbi:MAG: transposase [Acidobacteriota bacterium]|nr:transposase [Acidobacteriota bacterium]
MAIELVSYADTNVVFRLANGDVDLLSQRAKRQIEATQVLISSAVLLELEMLHEIGKLTISANEILADLSQRIGLRVCQFPMAAVVASALGIKWTRDPGNRLIVANAMANNEAPLVTADRKIREHYDNAIW